MSKPKTARARISMTRGVTLPRSSQFDLASKISRRTYRILVARPLAPPPTAGYPVVTVTDGGLTFPIAAGQNLSFGVDGGKAALVVGVAYATDDPAAPRRLRTRDLTPETPLSRIHRVPGQPAPRLKDYGGAERFYRFLVEELRPAIAAAFPTDAADQTLYGHSLGGLFALGVMFNHPEAFRTYAASSPSIWWNRRALLKGEGTFARRVETREIAPRVLITIGAKEQTPTDPPPPGLTRAQMRKLSQRARMVDNARELGARLAALSGAEGYLAQFVEFADEDHMSVIPASLSRTLSFALRS